MLRQQLRILALAAAVGFGWLLRAGDYVNHFICVHGNEQTKCRRCANEEKWAQKNQAELRRQTEEQNRKRKAQQAEFDKMMRELAAAAKRSAEEDRARFEEKYAPGSNKYLDGMRGIHTPPKLVQPVAPNPNKYLEAMKPANERYEAHWKQLQKDMADIQAAAAKSAGKIAKNTAIGVTRGANAHEIATKNAGAIPHLTRPATRLVNRIGEVSDSLIRKSETIPRALTTDDLPWSGYQSVGGQLDSGSAFSGAPVGCCDLESLLERRAATNSFRLVRPTSLDSEPVVIRIYSP